MDLNNYALPVFRDPLPKPCLSIIKQEYVIANEVYDSIMCFLTSLLIVSGCGHITCCISPLLCRVDGRWCGFSSFVPQYLRGMVSAKVLGYDSDAAVSLAMYEHLRYHMPRAERGRWLGKHCPVHPGRAVRLVTAKLTSSRCPAIVSGETVQLLSSHGQLLCYPAVLRRLMKAVGGQRNNVGYQL